MTFQHRAGVTTYTSHCWFADGCVFGKQSPGPAFCRSNLQQTEPHFSRSYVCILPSSLTRGRSCALDYSSFLPVSVSGTVPSGLALDSISRHLDYVRFASAFLPLAHGSAQKVDLPASFSALPLRRELPFSRRMSPHASCPRNQKKCWNVHQLPIGYAPQPRLRGRLSPGRLPLPGRP